MRKLEMRYKISPYLSIANIFLAASGTLDQMTSSYKRSNKAFLVIIETPDAPIK